jgi:hypothetical protein
MHLVLGGVIGLDRQEGSRPHMQRDEMPGNAARIQARKQRVGEMQPRCGRGNRALLAGIDGLVILAVLRVLAALGGDIGWQRNVAGGHDRLVERRAGEIEDQLDLAALAALARSGIEHALKADRAIAAKGQPVTRLDALAGPHEGLPAVRARPHVQRCGDTDLIVTAIAEPFKLRRDHLGVVEHQRVTRLKLVREIADNGVGKPTIRGNAQHPRAVTRACGPQRDAVFGQIEIEKVNAHKCALIKNARNSNGVKPTKNRAYQ